MYKKIAVVSDIHSNWPAFRAVLEDLDREGNHDLMLCAGDIVGYSAFPNECLAATRDRGFISVAGNHDVAVREYRTMPTDARIDFERHQFGCNIDAHEAAKHNAEALTPENAAYLETLRTKPYFDVQSGFGMVHGSFAGRLEGGHPSTRVEGIYVTDEWLARKAMQNMFFYGDSDAVHIGLGIIGHTHIPTIASGWFNYDNFDFRDMAEFRGNFQTHCKNKDGNNTPVRVSIEPTEPKEHGFWKHKVLFNPGSVGQPRHGSPRACYGVIYIEGDHTTLELREVEYPIEETQRKMAEDKRFSDELIQRLAKGR